MGSGLQPESEARARVEGPLADAGWLVSDDDSQPGGGALAVREFGLDRRRLDYGLLVGGRLLGAVELKARGLPRQVVAQAVEQLSEALAQSDASATTSDRRFLYFTTGSETVLVEAGRPGSARDVSGFHRPRALARMASAPSLGEQVRAMPQMVEVPLRPYQAEALQRLELALAEGERRALLQVAQGAGQWAIAGAATYRLLRHTSVRRILVLVDRQDLAQQAVQALSALPVGDGRVFADDFSGSVATGEGDYDANVVVMTVQRLNMLLSGGADREGRRIVVPTDAFDFIWVAEAHRLVSGRWGEALNHLDAPVVGMTATPTPEGFRFFDGNLVANIDLNTLLQAGVLDVRQERQAVSEVLSRADAYRGSHWRTEALLRALQETDAALNWRELSVLLERAELGTWSPAPFVLDFLAAYLRDRGAEWAIDPAIATPALLAAVVQAGAAKKAVGLVPRDHVQTIADALVADERLTWTRDDALLGDARAADIGSPDLLVSFPPLGERSEEKALAGPGGSEVRVRDELGYQLLLGAASQLAADGEGIFLVGDAFFARREPTRARAVLASLGFHVHAVVALRQAFHATSAALNLVFVQRERPDTVFVGELSPQVDVQQLVSNLKSRRRGPVPALGRLVAWESFQSYARTAGDERVEALLAETGLPVVLLKDILAEPLSAPPRQDEDFEPRLNSVYLPMFANATAHASREELTSKPTGYIQVVLEPDKALADYVALLLNTSLGRALRESISSGGVRATLRRSSLPELPLPLPDLSTQQQVVEARARIRNLRLELDALDRRLSAEPDQVADVAATLDELGQHDPVTAFRETLPFPLASILWRYEADADEKEKVEHLHRFFEACAAYFATVLLSAFRADSELFDENVRRWARKLRRGSFNRSSFGTWATFARQMTKSARRLLDGTDAERAQMVAAFSVGSDRFADAVSSHALWDLLDEAKEERNKSKGHGGLPGPSVIQGMHARLASLLSKLAVHLAEPMANVVLVRPGAGRFRRGINTYEKAEFLQGSNSIFRQKPLESVPQLEDDSLYLVAADSRPAGGALRMEPFFRLKPSPESAANACYFYSEIRNGEVEFISHHFEGQPSIAEPDPEVVELIGALSIDPDAS